MVDNARRFDPPIRRSAAVPNGTMAWLSRLLVASEPAAASTPTTVRSMLLIVTIWPTTSVVPNNSVAVVASRTTTAAESATSAAVRNEPYCIVRDRTPAHAAVVPTTEVVHDVEFAINARDDCLTGATPEMSGATTGEARAVASSAVSVDAEPNPPRIPEEFVALPGETMSRLLP